MNFAFETLLLVKSRLTNKTSSVGQTKYIAVVNKKHFNQ